MAATPNLAESATAPAGPSRSTLAVMAWGVGSLKSVITMAVAFVTTPYILHYLGADRLGAFRAAQQWTGYLIYLYFGLNPALAVMLLKFASRGEIDRAVSVVKAGIRLELRQSLIFVAPAGLLMAWFMPVLVPVAPHLQTELRIGALLFLLALPLAAVEVVRSFLECLQRAYLVHLALLVQAIITMVGAVWLAWCGYGLIGQFVAYVAGMLAFAMLIAAFAIPRLSGYCAAATRIDRAELRALRWPLMVTGIGSQLNLLTDYIIVGLAINPTAVTPFSLTQRLVTILGGFVTSLAGSTWAGLAEMIAGGDTRMIEERMLELLRLILGLSLTLLGTLAAYNFHFVRLWVGAQYYAGDLLTVLTAVQTLMFAFFTLFSWTIDMQGDARHRAPVTSFGAIVNVALSYVLGVRLGLYGVSLATVIGYGITEVWYNPYLFSRRYRVSLRALAATTLGSIALSAPWMVAVWMLAHRTRSMGWFELGFELGMMILLGALYSWLIILSSSDRALWKNRIGRLIANSRIS